MEPPYDVLDGVVSTTSGYIGGHVKNPTYEMVSSGGTGHTEAVQVVYDPAKVSYQELLDVFWINIDPTDAKRAVLRSRLTVPLRNLLSRRGAEKPRGSVAAEARRLRQARRSRW